MKQGTVHAMRWCCESLTSLGIREAVHGWTNNLDSFLMEGRLAFLKTPRPCGSAGKGSACQCRRLKRCWFDPWVRKIPWSRKWQPAPVFFPGKFHGQRSLVGYRPWGCKELEVTDCTCIHTQAWLSWRSQMCLEKKTRKASSQCYTKWGRGGKGGRERYGK